MKSKLGFEPKNSDLELTADGSDVSVVPKRQVPDSEAAACEAHDTDSEGSIEAVRENAYFRWQAAGCPRGNDLGFWLEAEAELRHEP